MATQVQEWELPAGSPAGKEKGLLARIQSQMSRAISGDQAAPQCPRCAATVTVSVIPATRWDALMGSSGTKTECSRCGYAAQHYSIQDPFFDVWYLLIIR